MSSPVGWACAIFAGLAVFWAIRSPAGAMRRVASRDGSGRSSRIPAARVLLGRGDAPPLSRRLVISVAATAAVCLAVSRLGGLGSLLWLALPPVAIVMAIGLGWLEPLAARRRRQALVVQSPQALELLAACLAAGMPARAACASVAAAFEGPVAEDLGRVMSATALGVSDAEAWGALQDHPQLGPAALDLARSVESGTRMVASLQHHAEVARERRRAALQVRARAVGVRSVLPLMTCFIPSFMLLGVVPTVVSAVTHALG
jgi:pilus assembly protein TadC